MSLINMVGYLMYGQTPYNPQCSPVPCTHGMGSRWDCPGMIRAKSTGPIDPRVAGIEREMKDMAIRSVPEHRIALVVELWLDEN